MLKRSKTREISMRDRFLSRVLMPPFILLLIIGGIFFWQFNIFMTERAIDELQVAAQTTAIRLERELAIRKTVLENTGNEIAAIKQTYITNLENLENNRAVCRTHYLETFNFTNSPDNACDSFAQATVRPSLAVIEDNYIEQAKSLQAVEIESINQRLSAYKQFFPETLVVMVTGQNGEILSFAASGNTGLSADEFVSFTAETGEAINGNIIEKDSYKLSLLAFPAGDGSVLAAYNVADKNYVLPTWQSTPINQDEAVAIIVESGQQIVYPILRDDTEFLLKTKDIQSTGTIVLDDVENTVVSSPVEDSNWSVLVVSPSSIVFAPIRDAQIIAIAVTAIFITGFLWVGSFFIKKTTDNLAHLVTGAMVYGTGRYDYKLNINANEKEFRQLADTMYFMAQQIAKNETEKDEKNKEFISIATHELRAPMTSIIGYLSMLKENVEHKLNKQDKMLLATAYDGTVRLRDLVNDMLDVARLEGGREEFAIKKIAISTHIKDCLSAMKVVADEAEVTLKYSDKHATDVYADEGKLRIILNNFISNAIKYNHKKGKIEISHIKHENELITTISNTGPTIPAEQQKHMFEKFFRVDTPEHRKVKGTGIGMFVTKQYIETMGGKVWFSSSPGQTTIFYFSLPLSGQHVGEMKQIKTAPKKESKWIMRWRRRMK